MKLKEFDKNKYGIEGTGIDVVTKKEIWWTDKQTQQKTLTIPTGTKVHIWFSPKVHPQYLFIQSGDEVKISKARFGFDKFSKITKCPSTTTLQKYSWNGISKSVVGEKVEADGYGPTGAPSWELVLGVI